MRKFVSKIRVSIPLCVTLVACGANTEPPTPDSHPEQESLRGVNLAGADFGETALPGVFDQDYTYPTTDEVDYFVGKGMNVFRIPFRWERLQQSLGAELDVDEEARLRNIVEYATERGAAVILDPHNYARYHGSLIGQGPSVGDFAEFWTRLATLYRANRRVIFGLMNEPYEIRAEAWLAAANAAIAAIRATGATNLILVPGTNWSGAGSWSSDWGYGTNADTMQAVVDPADRFMFEVHQYFDSDSSGTSSTCVSATPGSELLAGFTDWLRYHRYRGVLGEFGVGNDETCLTALRDVLAHMDENGDVWHGWTYWAAGPWWGDYRFSIEPEGCADKPQMTVLLDYLP